MKISKLEEKDLHEMLKVAQAKTIKEYCENKITYGKKTLFLKYTKLDADYMRANGLLDRLPKPVRGPITDYLDLRALNEPEQTGIKRIKDLIETFGATCRSEVT